MTVEQRLYKIRRKDGLFSTGGAWPSFKKLGKAWSGTGPLNNHLRMVYDDYAGHKEDPYADCEVVVFKVITTELIVGHEHDNFFTAMKDKIKAEKEEREERMRLYRENAAKKMTNNSNYTIEYVREIDPD